MHKQPGRCTEGQSTTASSGMLSVYGVGCRRQLSRAQVGGQAHRVWRWCSRREGHGYKVTKGLYVLGQKWDREPMDDPTHPTLKVQQKQNIKHKIKGSTPESEILAKIFTG